MAAMVDAAALEPAAPLSFSWDLVPKEEKGRSAKFGFGVAVLLGDEKSTVWTLW